MTIDMHSHWMPEELMDALRSRTEPPYIFRHTDGREYLKQLRGEIPLEPNFSAAESRIKLMDETGLSKSVLSFSGVYGIERLPIEQSLPLIVQFNNCLSELCQSYPERFSGYAMLPIADIVESKKELERSLDLPGIVGVLIPGNAFLDADRAQTYAPLLEIAHHRRAIVFVHSGVLPNDTSLPPKDNVDNGALRRGCLDMQARLSAIMVTFCLTDFLEPYSGAQFHLHNLGGNIPFEVDRLDHLSRYREPESELPSQKIRRSKVFLDCNSMGSSGIERAVEVYGADRIILGTDGTNYGISESLNAIKAARLSGFDQQLILSGNAARLLSIQNTADPSS